MLAPLFQIETTVTGFWVVKATRPNGTSSEDDFWLWCPVIKL